MNAPNWNLGEFPAVTLSSHCQNPSARHPNPRVAGRLLRLLSLNPLTFRGDWCRVC
jgi:hypothetical protein